MVGERRIAALRDLGAQTVEGKTVDEACAAVAESLAKHAKDLPFVLIYLIEPDGQRARLASAAGVSKDRPISPRAIER